MPRVFCLDDSCLSWYNRLREILLQEPRIGGDLAYRLGDLRARRTAVHSVGHHTRITSMSGQTLLMPPGSNVLNGFLPSVPLVPVQYGWLHGQALQTVFRYIPGPVSKLQDIPSLALGDVILSPCALVRGAAFLNVMCVAVPTIPPSPLQAPTGSDSQVLSLDDLTPGESSPPPLKPLNVPSPRHLDWRSRKAAAVQLDKEGRITEALEGYEQCLSMLGGGNRATQTYIEILERMAVLFQQQKLDKRALEYYGRAMSLKEQTKLLQCPQCTYQAFHKGNLALHMRTHTGEKPFPCPHCPYAAARRGHLNVHIRTHTGDKPYPCNSCNYAAKTKSQLEGHLRTHTGETPFKCPRCPYAARQQGTLGRHVTRRHAGETDPADSPPELHPLDTVQ